MANIDQYLAAILAAEYGEEVRGSIHDAIEAVNDETASSTSKTNQLQNAVNTLAAAVDDLDTSKQDTLTFDSTPTANSNNPVTSAGIKNAIDSLDADKQDTLTFDAVPTYGSTNPVTSGGIKDAIDDVIDAVDGLGEEIDDLDAAKQDTLTFDSTPTTGSTNPVTSGGIKTAIDTVDAALGTLGETVSDLSDAVDALETDKQDVLTFDTTPTTNSTNPVTSGGVKAAIDAAIAGSGSVISVNDVDPDSSGNVKLLGSDIAVSSTDNRTVAQAIAEAGPVKTVNSVQPDNTGDVEVTADDISQTAITTTNGTVEEALDALDTNKLTDILYVDRQILKSKDGSAYTNVLTVDSTPTTSSTNPVTSGGVKAAIDALDGIVVKTINNESPVNGNINITPGGGDGSVGAHHKDFVVQVSDWEESLTTPVVYTRSVYDQLINNTMTIGEVIIENELSVMLGKVTMTIRNSTDVSVPGGYLDITVTVKPIADVTFHVDFVANGSDVLADVSTLQTTVSGLVTNKVNYTDIYDDLDSTATNQALSANQGKALKDTIDALDATDIAGGVTATGTTVAQDLSSLKEEKVNQDTLAIVATGDTHAEIKSGEFVYVRNHSTLADGLYYNNTNATIAQNQALTTSNLESANNGGLNVLNNGSIKSSVYTGTTNSLGRLQGSVTTFGLPSNAVILGAYMHREEFSAFRSIELGCYGGAGYYLLCKDDGTAIASKSVTLTLYYALI